MPFSIGSSLRFGWETFKKRPWLFVGASFLLTLAYTIVGGISIDCSVSGVDCSVPPKSPPTLIGELVRLLVLTLIGMGATNFYLKAYDQLETVGLSSLWHPRPFLSYLAAAFLVGITIGIGFLLLIVPGIIFARC
jgi:hypothetical protein